MEVVEKIMAKGNKRVNLKNKLRSISSRINSGSG